MMNRRYRHFLDSNGRVFFIRSSTAICSETFLHKLPMCLSNFILSYFHSKIAVLPVTLPLHYNCLVFGSVLLHSVLLVPFVDICEIGIYYLSPLSPLCCHRKKSVYRQHTRIMHFVLQRQQDHSWLYWISMAQARCLEGPPLNVFPVWELIAWSDPLTLITKAPSTRRRF